MAKIQFIRGNRSLYNSASHVDAIFFAQDTHEIVINDVVYGINTDDAAKLASAIKSAEVKSGENQITFTKVDNSTFTVSIPEASESLAGLMSAADKAKLNLITVSEATNLADLAKTEYVDGQINAVKGTATNVEGGEYTTIGALNDALKETQATLEALGGAGSGSVTSQIQAAITALKGVPENATLDYDTLYKLQEAIKDEVNRAKTAEGTKSDSSTIVATDLWAAIEEIKKAASDSNTGVADRVTSLEGKVGNTDDASTESTLFGKVAKINETLPLKADLVSGKVPAAQLPSFVDDVIEGTLVNNTTFTPSDGTVGAAGEAGKIYVDTTSNKTYRWSGTQYTEISESLALGETADTAYAGDKGKALRDEFDAHVQANTTKFGEIDEKLTALEQFDGTVADSISNAVTAAKNELKGDVESLDTLGKLEDAINTEVTNRQNADTAINDKIGTEKTESEAATGLYLYIDNKVNGVSTDLTDLSGRVTVNEGKLAVIQGNESTEGSINKALADAKKYTDDSLTWVVLG